MALLVLAYWSYQNIPLSLVFFILGPLMAIAIAYNMPIGSVARVWAYVEYVLETSLYIYTMLMYVYSIVILFIYTLCFLYFPFYNLLIMMMGFIFSYMQNMILKMMSTKHIVLYKHLIQLNL